MRLNDLSSKHDRANVALNTANAIWRWWLDGLMAHSTRTYITFIEPSHHCYHISATCLRVGLGGNIVLSLNQKPCSTNTFFIKCGADCGLVMAMVVAATEVAAAVWAMMMETKMRISFTSNAEVRTIKWISIQCVKYIICKMMATKNHFCATNLMVASPHVMHSPFFQW